MALEQVSKELQDCGYYFLATVEEDQPRVRPIGLQFIDDGKLYFAVGEFKQCYKQMKANPKVEICGCNTKTNTTIRVSGKATFVKDEKLVEKIFTIIPDLKKIYDGKERIIAPFYLDDIHAVHSDMAGMDKKQLL